MRLTRGSSRTRTFVAVGTIVLGELGAVGGLPAQDVSPTRASVEIAGPSLSGMPAHHFARTAAPPPLMPKSFFNMSVDDWEVYLNGDPSDPSDAGISFITTVDPTSPNRGERRKLPANPPGSGHYTKVVIYPAEGIEQLSVTSTSDFPVDRGRVIAQIINEGFRQEHGWTLTPQRRYFLVGERDSDGTLYGYIVAPGFKPRAKLTLVRCHGPEGPAYTRAQFAAPEQCDPRERGIQPRFLQPTDSPWFTCAQGCCTGGGVVQLPGQIPCPKGKVCPAFLDEPRVASTPGGIRVTKDR
jgi:hypothetical protein